MYKIFISLVAVGFSVYPCVTSAIQCKDNHRGCVSNSHNLCRDRPDAFLQMCKKSCGICSKGRCITGYYGNSCEPCKNLCLDGDSRCGEPVGQECLQDCPPGYHGVNCEIQCNTGCGHGACDKWSGYCLIGCKHGYYGSLCEKFCSGHCKDKKCGRSSNHCVDGCETGWYGVSCFDRCSETCVGRICDSSTGTCSGGCREGWFGKTCRSKCPPNCQNGTCDSDTRSCNSCKRAWFGDNCQTLCPPNCTHDTCHIEDGSCTEGCKHGWFGKNCSSACPATCAVGTTCDVDTGVCTSGCIPAWHGPACSQQECEGCVNNSCTSTGRCRSCSPGLYGETCNLTCPDGCLNDTCRRVSVLPDSTRTDTNNTTEFEAGQCIYGCTKGSFGEFCNMTCPVECKKGSCDVGGDCDSGCEDGFYGTKCDQICKCGNGSRCHQNESCVNACNDCEGDAPRTDAQSGEVESIISASAVFVVAVVVGVVTAWRVFKWYRRGGKYPVRPLVVGGPIVTAFENKDGYASSIYLTTHP